MPSCQKITPGATWAGKQGFSAVEGIAAVIARTDPHERDSVVLLADVDALVP